VKLTLHFNRPDGWSLQTVVDYQYKLHTTDTAPELRYLTGTRLPRGGEAGQMRLRGGLGCIFCMCIRADWRL
jgi:hypothetical protein